MSLNFEPTFEALTGKKPFPWQTAFYKRFELGEIPKAATLPTGLGKTSVIAIWLIALANKCNIPRRLVYVVNRRTVVDQTTEEVEKYKKAKVDGIADFALSTLRGQFADNREWSADPSRPAVICGTVDMIGSRLLFSGYGLGMGSKPLHAGFLGQDALLIHDEAHLEPAFQTLLETIVAEQTRCKEFGKFQVKELTATSRGAVSRLRVVCRGSILDTPTLRARMRVPRRFDHVRRRHRRLRARTHAQRVHLLPAPGLPRMGAGRMGRRSGQPRRPADSVNARPLSRTCPNSSHFHALPTSKRKASEL